MTTSLLEPAQWAQTEFALAQLGDQRRTQRLVKMASSLAQTPTGTLPQAFPDWKDLKAAYRLVDHIEFGPADIQQPHWQRTLEACRQPGEYLLIEDTTQRRLDQPDGSHCARQTGRIFGTQTRRHARVANDLAWLEQITVHV